MRRNNTIMGRNSTLILAATAGALGASFFVGEPQVKQRVMTEFDVMNIEAAKRKRELRRMRKYQKGVLAKEDERQERKVADVVVIGHSPKNHSSLARLAHLHLAEPHIIVIDPVESKPDQVLLEALGVLSSLHRGPSNLG